MIWDRERGIPKAEAAETRAYLELMVRKVRRRYDIRMRQGHAAADIDTGRFAAWTNPEPKY